MEKTERSTEEERLNDFFLEALAEGLGTEDILSKARKQFPGISRGGLLALFREFLGHSRKEYCERLK